MPFLATVPQFLYFAVVSKNLPTRKPSEDPEVQAILDTSIKKVATQYMVTVFMESPAFIAVLAIAAIIPRWAFRLVETSTEKEVARSLDAMDCRGMQLC
jgi:hypothetical protein